MTERLREGAAMTPSSGTRFPYRSPAAFRAALTDRLKRLAESSRFTLTELQRQFAYDRLLARIFSAPDAEHWVLKGATALLARLDVARHSKDVDLSWWSSAGIGEAEYAFREAANRDVGDFFIFEVGPASPLIGDIGLRLAVVSDLGGRPFTKFSVDLVTGQSMTSAPDLVPPLVAVEIPGLLRVNYTAYPLADHIADKVAACLQGHVRAGAMVASTRYKDLVDLVLIARTQRPGAGQLRRAVLTQTVRCGIGLPAEFSAPGPTWPAGYEAKAAEVPELGDLATFSTAMALAKKMLDPIFQGVADGQWDPDRAEWIG
jgi:Nucleotidyl transferase AbiEii toxin, Type IV TA system